MNDTEVNRKWHSLCATVADIQQPAKQKHRAGWNKVTIELHLDPKWKWIARQSYGTYTLFTEKPYIYRAVEDQYEDGFVPCYWKCDGEEQDICTDGPEGGNWRRSCKRLA